MERQGNRKEYVEESIDGEYPFIQLLRKRNDNNLENDIKTLKKNHVQVNYYFGDTADEVKELIGMGIDFVLTNKLSEMLEVAESIGIIPQNFKNYKNNSLRRNDELH